MSDTLSPDVPINLGAFRLQLRMEESLKCKPYKDTVGKLTIGYGRNLDDVGITPEEAAYLLDNDIAGVLQDLDSHLPWWRKLPEVRQRVLADMCFNLGIVRLLKFEKMIAAVRAEDYAKAADEMLASKWADETKTRAGSLIRMMKEGR